MTTIALDAPVDETQIDELPGGHQRITPKSGGRTYKRAGEDEPYRSISGLPWPDDFTGATRYMAGKYVARSIADIAATPIDEIPKKVAAGAEHELNNAAARGTAVHRYIECRVLGQTPPWDEIDAAGACDWLPAADAYLKDHPALPGLDEIVVFGESCGVKIAGTVDRVDLDGVVVVRDYKTRTTRHDRRAKEAAQLGAYAHCLLHGVYVDERGHDRTLERIDHCEVVTFCPDGTYAVHRVELADALRAHEARMPFVSLGVGDLYAKAERGMAPTVAEVFQAELDAMDDECRMALAMLWREHGMPRIAELTEAHYATARRLFMQAGPFEGHEPTVPPLATDQQRDDIRRRLAALPDDIRKQALEAAR